MTLLTTIWLSRIQGPPGEPSMTLRVDHENFAHSDDEVIDVRAGQSISLRCTSRGGSPVPTVTFLKNGQSFGPGPNTFQNTHSFVAKPSDNNAVYSCSAQNMVDRRVGSATFRLNVLCKYRAWCLE